MLSPDILEPVEPTDHPLEDHGNSDTHQTTDSRSPSLTKKLCSLLSNWLSTATEFIASLSTKKQSKSKLFLNLLALSAICFSRDLFFNDKSFDTISEMKQFGFHVALLASLVFISGKYSKFLRSCFGLLILGVLMVTQSRQHIGHQSFHVEPLFEAHSLVTDYAYGEFSMLRKQLLRSDMTLVLFYAPWDRETIEFKDHFSSAALYYHEQVNFVGINCWLPGSECRKHYRLLRYPTVMMFVRLPSSQDFMNIYYDGPLDSYGLIEFVRKALSPLHYISNQAQLDQLRIFSDALVVGFVPDRHSMHFDTFYYSALERLGFSSLEKVSYALTFNSSILPHGQSEPTITLFNWNDTLVYPALKPWNVGNITDWVKRKHTSAVQWLTFSDRKTQALDTYLSEGPVLFVATPMNPFVGHHDVILLMKALSMEYQTCHPSNDTHDIMAKMKELIAHSPGEPAFQCRSYLQHRKNVYRQPLFSSDLNGNLSHSPCPMERETQNHFTPDPWEAKSLDLKTFFSRYFQGYHTLGLSPQHHMLLTNHSLLTKGYSRGCFNNKVHVPQESTLPYRSDELVELSASWHLEDTCRSWALGSMTKQPLKIPRSYQFSNITALGCSHNDSLTFALVNSIDNVALLQRFSLPINATSAWIVHPARDQHYVMEEPLSLSTLSSYIGAFHEERLPRTLFSSGEASHSPGKIAMQDLTSDNYLHVVGQSGIAHFVLHYSPECGQCRAVSHVLLTCSELIASSGVIFSRIDVTKNTLPWSYTFQVLPTIIFYPKIRKAETQTFRVSSGYTVQSLMTFILQNLEEEDRRSVIVSLCDEDCRSKALALKYRRMGDARKKLDHFLRGLSVESSKTKEIDSTTEQNQLLHLRNYYFSSQIRKYTAILKSHESLEHYLSS